MVRFTQSVKGLLPGAPVEYRGVRIGRVEKLLIKEMIRGSLERFEESHEISGEGRPIPVLIYVEPGRMALPDTDNGVSMMRQVVASGVPKGLRASLETGNLLTGAKYIGLDYYPDDGASLSMQQWHEFEEIPTVGGSFDQILIKLNEILKQVNDAPIEQTVVNANKMLDGIQVILNSKEVQQLPGLAPDSELYQNLDASMRKLDKTLSNIEALTHTLSGQPNAAIMGSKQPPDPEPEAGK